MHPERATEQDIINLDALAAWARQQANQRRTQLQATHGITLPAPVQPPVRSTARPRKPRPATPALQPPPPVLLPSPVPAAALSSVAQPGAFVPLASPAVPARPRQPVRSRAVPQQRIRRPLKDLTALTRVRLPTDGLIPFHTVKQVGPVELQRPVDHVSLPQATKLPRGLSFEYHWRYGEVSAEEKTDELGRRWVYVYVGGDPVPSVRHTHHTHTKQM